MLSNITYSEKYLHVFEIHLFHAKNDKCVKMFMYLMKNTLQLDFWYTTLV